MALILRRLISGYKYFFEELSDPRTEGMFLMSSPIPIICIMAIYTYFVNELGPKWMQLRPPFKLDRIVQVYDAIQICMSMYLLYAGFRGGWGTSMKWICEPVDFSDEPKAVWLLYGAYLYFLVKIVDLLDTVFFVLRKKTNQITFLHVYHHAMMVLVSWVGAKFVGGGGHFVFLGLCNSAVHVVMYSYYLLTSIYHRNNIWWKKYITQLQMIQFFLIGIHGASVLFVSDCENQFKWLAFMVVPQNVFLGFLFYDFYRKAYGKSKLEKKPR